MADTRYIPIKAPSPDDVSVIQTDRYTLIKIPKPYQPTKSRQVSIDDFAGALADVPEYEGKSSVKVQHMTRELWTGKNKTRHQSS
jgi:hypothetical protein